MLEGTRREDWRREDYLEKRRLEGAESSRFIKRELKRRLKGAEALALF